MLKITFKSKNDKITKLAPTRIIVFSFVALILTGAVLLTLPISSRSGNWTPFIDALFTSTSASCVTGLVVYDTYNHWSTVGQVIILMLIQAGGLGIITLATFFSVLFGRKVGLRGMILAQESINNFSFEGVLRLIKKVVLVTLSVELIGALLLSISFVPRFGLKGFYFGLFHGVSAFCNAGFDLMSSMGKGEFVSLTSFNNDPIVIYTIPALIIIGGLGFIVWKDLYEYKKTKSLMLHTKVVLVITAVLIVSGAVFFFFAEYNNTMSKMNLFEKFNAAVFHSVTTRTAGFNSLDLNGMYEISKFATVVLMFIGAAPGSTGGGIKVTTFGVIVMAIISQIRGSNDTVIFKRRVPHYTVNKALAITGLSAIIVLTVTTVVLGIEKGVFINVLYEATSAFGTVGLSTGITPNLHFASKLFILITMFFGRVGPLTFAIALTLKANKKDQDVVYPEGKIMVG